jgi:hypothetical protein
LVILWVTVVMRMKEPVMSDWGEIEPYLLEDVRGAVPGFPLDLLPPFWRDWVGAAGRSAGAPGDYVALSVLAAVAGLAGGGAQVRITPRWAEPLVLWQAMVGPPSSGKSSAMAPARDMLLALEPKPKPSADGAEKPRRVVEDAGLDHLADALDAHPRGVILWRDEPVDLPARLGCPVSGRPGTGRLGDDALVACWRQAWSGGPVTPGKGARRFNRFAVSLLVALQPERMAELLRTSEEFSARFLFTWPHTPAYAPLTACAPLHDDEALAALRLLDDRLTTSTSGGEPLGLAFDEAGLRAFDTFANHLHDERRDVEGLELAWIGKGASTVTRLAGVLQLLEWSRDASAGGPGAIGREQVERAIALWSDYFRPHALALFHRMAPTEHERRARTVVRWLQRKRKHQVSREDIRRNALSRAVNAIQTEQILLGLQQDGVVERASDGSQVRGRPSSKWWVNPALFESPLAGNTEKTSGG